MLRSRAWALTWTVLRLAMTAAIVAAIAAQLTATTITAIETNRNVSTTIANFFSFFTILSNLGAAIVLTWAALWFLTRGRRTDAAGPGSAAYGGAVEPPVLAGTLASITTYMLITGVVYNALLRGIPLLPGNEPIPWSNEVLHLVAPLFFLLDVLIAPARRPLGRRIIWAIVVFPVVWVVYTLIRGPLVADPTGSPPWWYPYPFLNPNNFDSSYLTVSLYIVGIALAIVGVGALVLWISRRRAAPRS